SLIFCAMEDTSVALQKINIRGLDPNLENVLIVGVIIAKQRPKKFLDTKAAVETYKAVWNFTIRDSIQDYINVTYWSSSEAVFQANDKFHTGDVVEVINPKITVRKINDHGEQFRPMVTSPFSLSLSERSAIVKHDGDNRYYLKLLKYPTKPIAGFLPLRDIHNRGDSIKDTYVDILAAVRGLSSIRTVTTKNNENLQVRTVEVFDHTSPSLKINLWEPDLIASGRRLRGRFVVKATGRTIVTENPDGRETQLLLNYAKTAPIETFEIIDQLLTALPNPNTIQDVMSVKQVQDKINYFLQENKSGTKQFTALLYAFVTNLDLDGLSRTLLMKCGHCKMPMNGSTCDNSECPTVFENAIAEPEAREFSSMSDEHKCKLKWRYLMERCAVRIAVTFIGRQNPIVSVLHVKIADTLEVARKLPVY
ncbi:hypothetical protein NQ318_003291, partial [Aromia moschata]